MNGHLGIMSSTALGVEIRGGWGARAARHEAGTPVRVGDEFITEIALPVAAGRRP